MNNKKLSKEQFLMRAFERLPNKDKGFKGFQTVISGFNDAFRDYFGQEPVPFLKAQEKAGKIVSRGKKGVPGSYVKLAKDVVKQSNGRKALDKMGL